MTTELSESRNRLINSAAKRYERVYKEKRFTPVEHAFPSLGVELWKESDTAAALSPPDARLLTAAFLGPQNAGKTSLTNALALSTVGAVSTRYGSTKDCKTSVATVHSTQLLLVDTPGIHAPHKKVSPREERWFSGPSARSLDAIFAADVVVLVLPVGVGFVEEEPKKIALEVASRCHEREVPLVLALSMVDRLQTPRHREMYFAMRTDLESLQLRLAAVQEVSVKGGTGLVALKDRLCSFAHSSPWRYHRHESSSSSPVERVGEVLRQSFLELLPHEMPHKLQHKIVGWTTKSENSVEVVVEVFLDRPAYLFTFYSKLEAIAYRAHQILLQEWDQKYFFVMQGFVSPGGVSTR